jgi:UDP-4-amino-4,6-dideoxy-N-acetyl-beta-L-altrosamine transaminase
VIPYGRQSISEEDIRAVVEVLRSEFLTQGPVVARFEKSVADYCNAPHAVAVNSGTSALHIACQALGLGPGDSLWTSPNTFVASANCARYCGADVDFVDIDPDTYNISVEALARKLERAAAAGKLPKVLVPVHFSGQSCEMREIWALSGRYGFRILEDASHALGAEYDGAKVGACAYSHAAVLSFHPVKHITTGEGGMVLTRDPGLAEALRQLRSHGITRDEELMRGPSEGAWYYQQLQLGYNFRMTDLQAALGASQMQRLDAFLARRRQLAKRYDAVFAGLAVKVPARSPSGNPAWHLYVVQVENRKRVFDALRRSGIGVNVHYIPVHYQPYYQALGFKRGDFPQAERYYEHAISLPMYSDLSDADQERVVSALRQATHA